MAAGTTGRFNWLTTKPDLYDVLFRTIYGNVMIVIARDLDRDAALEMVKDLNEIIDDIRRQIVEEGD